MSAVTPSQRMLARRSPRRAATTAKCMAPLDETRTTVASEVVNVSSLTPSGGHGSLSPRRV
jgi:hypothetical protein